jgi:hypothetical protein
MWIFLVGTAMNLNSLMIYKKFGLLQGFMRIGAGAPDDTLNDLLLPVTSILLILTFLKLIMVCLN